MQATLLGQAISPGLLYHSRNDAGPSNDPFRFSATTRSKPKRRLRTYPSSKSSDTSGYSSSQSVEEELVWYDRTLVWSRGAQIFRKYTFDYEGEDVAWAEFVWFKTDHESGSGSGSESAQARSTHGKEKSSLNGSEIRNQDQGGDTFGPFHVSQRYHWGGPRVGSAPRGNHSANPTSRLERTLVVFLQTRAHVYYASGEDMIINMPFVVDGAWALESGGLVVQRALEKREIRRMKKGGRHRDSIALGGGGGGGSGPNRSLLRGIDQSSISILDDLVDLEDETTPSLPRLYTLDDPFHELKMIVEATVEGGHHDTPSRITSQTSPIASTSTLLHLSNDGHPLVVYHDLEEGSIIFSRRIRVPPIPETPQPPTPGPRTMRPEDILKPPEPALNPGQVPMSGISVPGPSRSRPSLHRNPSSIAPAKTDRRTSTTADPFDRSQRRNQPRQSKGGESEIVTGELQAALEPGPLVNPAMMIQTSHKGQGQIGRPRGLSVVSGPTENRRTSGASSFLRQDLLENRPEGKNALHVAAEKDLRETTMMLGLEREDMETELRSDWVFDRIWMWKLPPDTNTDSLKVFVSDNLSPESITLNVHIASAQSEPTLFTFSVVFEPTSRRYTVTPFQSVSCVAAIPLISTRSRVVDVICLSTQGDVDIITSGGRNIPLIIPLHDLADHAPIERNGMRNEKLLPGELASQNNIIDLVDPAGTTFTAVLQNGQRIKVSADFTIQDDLTSACLEAISLTVAPHSFYLLKKEIILAIQRLSPCRRSDPYDVFDVFYRVLREILGMSTSSSVNQGLARDPIMRKLQVKLKVTVKAQEGPPIGCRDRMDPAHIAAILFALHLVAQNCRLLTQQSDLHLLVPVICQLASSIGKLEWVDYWMRCFPTEYVVERSYKGADTSCLDGYETPPDILFYLSRRLVTRTKPFAGFPSQISELGRPQPLLRITQVCQVYDHLGISEIEHDPKRRSDLLIARASRAVNHMVQTGLGTAWLTSLPYAVAVPILEMIRVCQNTPEKTWSIDVFHFIGRSDLAMQRQGLILPDEGDVEEPEVQQPLIGDLIIVDNSPKKAYHPSLPHVRFGSDRRLQEVERIMQTTQVRTIAAQEQKNASEQDVIHYHQSVVNTIANRTLSTPVGQGIFEFGTRKTTTTGIWEIPAIELSVKIVPGSSVLKAQIMAENANWPCFHNGVSAGLSISPECKGIDSSWIVFNRPHTLNPEHGGFLLGLGLTGHLRSLLAYHAFPYMEPRHEFTSVGLLLGLACSYAGGGDLLITKILSLHTHALLPLGSMELHASPLIQSTAILGLGLVYVGSKNNRMAEVALNEVGRPDMSGVDAFGDYQESYAFSASMAFGLIMLGRGANSEVDRRMMAKLRKCIDGDPLDLTTTATSALTSPGATLALGLMYLKSGRKEVADSLTIPQTVFELDQIRPELLLIRVLARSLIMWDEISPAIGWIEAQLPAFIHHQNHKKTSTMDFATELAYLNIVSGACFAIGIKYAGTAAELAHNNLMFFYGVLGKIASNQSMTYEGKIRRNTARNGLNIVTIALSAVMSGTGELNVLRRLRVAHGQEGAGVNYGSHMALHMATGLLFLGRGHYTLGNSNLAIAAMCISFFPRFLPAPGDNKAYPQAFRHLWALAVEPRCLIAKDIDTRETVYLPVKIKLQDGDRIRQQALISPTLISPFESLVSIEVDSPRYWPIHYDLYDPTDRASLVRSRIIYVKRKAGFLDYNSDPKGNRSIFIRAGSMTGFDMHYDLISPASPPGLESDEVIDLVREHSGSPYLTGMAKLFSGASRFETFLRTALLECVSLDKQVMIGIYMSTYLALLDPASKSGKLSSANFLRSYYSPSVYETNYLLPNSNGERRIALLRPSFLTAVGRHLSSIEVNPVEKLNYLSSGQWPVSSDAAAKLSIYIAQKHVPAVPLMQALQSLVSVSVSQPAPSEDIDMLMMRARDSATRYANALEAIYDLNGARVDVPAWRNWKADSVKEAITIWVDGANGM